MDAIRQWAPQDCVRLASLPPRALPLLLQAPPSGALPPVPAPDSSLPAASVEQMADLQSAILTIDAHLDAGGAGRDAIKALFGLAELADDECVPPHPVPSRFSHSRSEG